MLILIIDMNKTTHTLYS